MLLAEPFVLALGEPAGLSRALGPTLPSWPSSRHPWEPGPLLSLTPTNHFM